MEDHMSLSMEEKEQHGSTLGRSLEMRAEEALMPLAVDMSGSFSMDLSRFILAGAKEKAVDTH